MCDMYVVFGDRQLQNNYSAIHLKIFSSQEDLSVASYVVAIIYNWQNIEQVCQYRVMLHITL